MRLTSEPIAFQSATTARIQELKARKPIDKCAAGCAGVECNQGRLPCPHHARYVADMREMGVDVEHHETERRRFRAGQAAVIDDPDLWRRQKATAAPAGHRSQVIRAAYRGAFWRGWLSGVVSGALLAGLVIGVGVALDGRPVVQRVVVRPLT